MSDVRRLSHAWAVLTAITVGTWWLGHAPTDPAPSTRTLVTIAALAIAAVKVQIIVSHFMEVRTGPTWLRTATAAWLVTLLAILLVVYLW